MSKKNEIEEKRIIGAELDYRIMLLTCDEYCDLWDPFFGELERYWPEYKGSVLINTETIREYKGNSIKKEFPDEVFPIRGSWSERLYKCLKQVKQEYVLLLLDDFIITGFVDNAEINNCVVRMKGDNSIACFNFRSTRGKSILDDSFELYELKERKAVFRINLQAALWRKEFLLKFIRKHENPWQFETWGSMRARRYKDKIYHLKINCDRVIIPYLNGGVIADNRWRGKEAIELLRSAGYDMDFDKREVYIEGDSRKTEIVHRSFLKKCWEVLKSLI